MELRHPLAFAWGVAMVTGLFVLFFFLQGKDKKKYPVASFGLVAHLPEVKKALWFQRTWKALCAALLYIASIFSLVLMARPSRVVKIDSGLRQRDIFLCLDVSYSLTGLNKDLVENLKSVVGGLGQDRFAILIFNTSSVLYVPMTTDHEFVIEKLDELSHYFDMQAERMAYDEKTYLSTEDYDALSDLIYRLDYYDAGTLVNNMTRGSSLIGEGLASCLYRFPDLDTEQRTRVIIMTTDNDQQALKQPIVEFAEAADLCASHGVSLFGIYPDKASYYNKEQGVYEANKRVMEAHMEKLYVQSEMQMSEILADIERHEALKAADVSTTQSIDEPQLYMNGLIVSLVCFVGLYVWKLEGTR